YVRGQVKGCVTMRVPTRLIVRESCGCLPGELQHVPVSHPLGLDTSHPPYVSPDVASVTEALTELVFNQTHRLNLSEVRALCTRLVSACCDSLSRGEALTFRRSVQQILEHVVTHEDGLQGWQTAISALREQIVTLKARVTDAGQGVRLSEHEIEDMWHQARIAITGMAQGQHAREVIREADNSYHLYQMTARFQTAREEADVVGALNDTLPRLGIQHGTVALYEAEGTDPVAWSVVQAGPSDEARRCRFRSREFPPEGLYAPDGPFHLAVTPLLLQGRELAGFVAFDMGNLDLCADITWLLAAAFHGLQSYRAALEGRRLAEEANRLKGRFLSMVSHELRTPLNVISGISDLLLQESGDRSLSPDKGMWEDLERIYVNAQHLDDLLRDVLDLARSEAGQLRLAFELLDVREVLEPISAVAGLLVREKSLVWRAEIPDDLPCVWGDRTRLRQVVLNLVNNAVKFTARGEVVLVVASVGDTVRISVRDTGLGIPSEEQSAIFDEFRQSERTTARGYGGLGLGLAICKLLIEGHGGEIGVASSGEEGDGSEFFFTLPAIAGPGPLAEAECTAEAAQRILLLVGDLERGRTLQAHWRQKGLQVIPEVVEQSGEWLSAVLRAFPRAVILDQDVVAGWGSEILRALKENPRTRRVPVLFLGEEPDTDRKALLEVALLTKPVGRTELGEALVAQGLGDHQLEPSMEKKILIVDDDPGSLEIHTRIVKLQSPTCRVLQARDGLEALDVIRQATPDLVLLDLMMPGLDGFGVLEAMRGQPESRSTPVIILTAQTLTEQDMVRLNRGMVSVLSKGVFTEEETLHHLTHILARQRKVAAEAQRFVLQAMAYIHTHYMAPISRSDIAAHVGVTERHLTRCFRQEIGITPISYLNRYRVRQARALLEASDIGITAVAMAVGFSSGGYFSRVFRQELGVSPLAYQRGERGDPAARELS
ncbi:MAG: response regulator, partial [Anaerolineae bacterium]|nr:response regulator [Anaerolineae bacterium]